jgi:hypothetical protein
VAILSTSFGDHKVIPPINFINMQGFRISSACTAPDMADGERSLPVSISISERAIPVCPLHYHSIEACPPSWSKKRWDQCLLFYPYQF